MAAVAARFAVILFTGESHCVPIPLIHSDPQSTSSLIIPNDSLK